MTGQGPTGPPSHFAWGPQMTTAASGLDNVLTLCTKRVTSQRKVRLRHIEWQKIMATTHVSRELLGYFHGLDDISKKRYCEKLKLCGLSEDPYIISKDKWTTERKFWPQIVFPDIYVLPCWNAESLHSSQPESLPFKSMDAYSYYVAGFVSDIISTKADKNCIIVRAKVSLFSFISLLLYYRCCLFCSATSVTFLTWLLPQVNFKWSSCLNAKFVENLRSSVCLQIHYIFSMTNIRCNATLLWIFPSASFFYVLYISMWLSVVKQLRTVRVRQLLERRSGLSHSVNKTRDIMHFNDTNQTIFCNHQLFNTNYWNNVSEISYIPETKWRLHNQSCSPGRHFSLLRTDIQRFRRSTSAGKR